MEVQRLEGRAPVSLKDLTGTRDDTDLLYGHLDKQPEIAGWREGLGPWTPVREGDKLYGRGGADDGYSAFASLLALRLLHDQKVPHARCIILIEAGEESGSPDLASLHRRPGARALPGPSLTGRPRLGIGRLPDALDHHVAARRRGRRAQGRGAPRGGALGVGERRGAVELSVLRQLLARIEDVETGRVLLPELHVEVPRGRRAEIEASAQTLRREVLDSLPWVEGMRPVTSDVVELILNRTWRPTLSVTGVEGCPRSRTRVTSCGRSPR